MEPVKASYLLEKKRRLEEFIKQNPKKIVPKDLYLTPREEKILKEKLETAREFGCDPDDVTIHTSEESY